MSKDFQQYCSELGIKLRPRTAYAPWSNGKIETMHSHLSRYVRTFISENGKNWPTLIPQFIFAYNTNINTSTGMSPYEILYGIKPSVPSTFKLGTFRKYNRTCDTQDPESFCYGLPQHTHEKPSLALNPHSQTFQAPLISQNILKRENQFKHIYSKAYQNSRKKFAQAHKYHNSHSLAKPLQIGSQVLLENHQIIPNLSKKFHQLRIGPLIIKDKPTEVTYNLIDPQTQKTYQAHRNHLIPYIPFKEYSKDLIEYNKKFPIQNYRTQQLNKPNQQTKQVRFNDQSEIIPDTYPQTPRQIIKPFQTPVGMGSPKYRLNYQAPPLLLTPATSRDHTAYQATPLRKTTPRYSATPLPTQIHPTQYQTPASIIRGNYSPIINSNRIPLFLSKTPTPNMGQRPNRTPNLDQRMRPKSAEAQVRKRNVVPANIAAPATPVAQAPPLPEPFRRLTRSMTRNQRREQTLAQQPQTPHLQTPIPKQNLKRTMSDRSPIQLRKGRSTAKRYTMRNIELPKLSLITKTRKT